MAKINKKRVSVSSDEVACSFCENLSHGYLLSYPGGGIYICDECNLEYTKYLLHKKDHQRKFFGELESEIKQFSSREGFEKIIRGFKIPPYYFEAAMLILIYITKKLREKCGEDELTVNIQQKGLKVRLVIEVVFWRAKEIRKTMHEYSLVLSGRMSIDDFSKKKSKHWSSSSN